MIYKNNCVLRPCLKSSDGNIYSIIWNDCVVLLITVNTLWLIASNINSKGYIKYLSHLLILWCDGTQQWT